MYTEKDNGVKLNLEYPFNSMYDYETRLSKIDLDKEREEDIRTGKGFVISTPRTIKKDLKDQDGIFSSRFGSAMSDIDQYSDRFSCKCGTTQGSVKHGMICPHCLEMVKYVDDDMSIFGWIILQREYYIIHPNLYKNLGALVGNDRIGKIIDPEVNVDKNGVIIENKKPKKPEDQFNGIGMLEFKERFDEIMAYFVKKYPQKRQHYNEIMKNRDIVFTQSIPVFTTLLRPTKYDSSGGLKYEKTNEDYYLINMLVSRCNKGKLRFLKAKKSKMKILFDIQMHFNKIYNELKEILSKKKGDIRGAVGGRCSFTARSVIKQGVNLKPYQIELPYNALCELLEQVIINILQRSYNFNYADAWKKWFKAQIKEDEVVYNIIMGLIKDSDGGLPILINRNPTIGFGGILFMKCIGINKNFTMSIPLNVLAMLGADFDGDTLNIMYLYNKDFIEALESKMSPEFMFISKNDGRVDPGLILGRDTIIMINSMKTLYRYTPEQKERIRRLQQMD